MSYVSREQLDRAKQVDLLTYLQQNEPEELVKLSPTMYSTRTHDSLKISNGLWHQWSTGIGGRSALDYLIKIRGMSLPDAVLKINSGTVYRPSFSYARKSADIQKFTLPERNENNDRVINYLVGRGIDQSIVLDLIAKGLIYEERTRHGAVFVGTDTRGKPRHASIRATDESRFMIDALGSDKHYSFSLTTSNSNELHIFESAIDALSFLSLEKRNVNAWSSCNVLSLSGVSKSRHGKIPMALRQYLNDHPQTNKVYFHLDNDPPGREATRQIWTALPPSIICFDLPPPVGKDYNDFLIWKTKSIERNDAR